MRPPPTTKQNAQRLLAQTYCSRFMQGAQPLHDRTRNGVFDSRRPGNGTRQERNTIMKPLMATAAEATDSSGWAAAPCTG